MDIIAEIKDLKQKKERAQMLLTKHQTQLESLTEQRDRLTEELKDKFGATVETAQEMVTSLSSSLSEKLEEAKEVLTKIDLS